MKVENKLLLLVIVAVTILSSNFLVLAKPEELTLTVIEMRLNGKPGGGDTIPPTDNSMSNPDYALLRYHWFTTANYYVNTENNYGFSSNALENAITTSAETWDDETGAQVFSYQGVTSKIAGKYDGYNVVSLGNYKDGVIGVTFLWRMGNHLIETDTILNTLYGWSLSDESGKMDVQNIMTHEFGHWCGLADLYKPRDYWLTMYGYSDFGLTYARILGLGDINGLIKIYGP